jgi:hypothetical protein
LKKVCPEATVWADPSGESGGKGMTSECRRNGLRVLAANTFSGSIKYGIALMKKYRIHLVEHPDVRKEATNYVYKEIRGFFLDDPIDDYNHFWDAVRMAVMSNVKR